MSDLLRSCTYLRSLVIARDHEKQDSNIIVEANKDEMSGERTQNWMGLDARHNHPAGSPQI